VLTTSLGLIQVEIQGAILIEMQREDGVLSSKQGDYTITYKSGSPMRFPIPRAAVDRLAKYLCSGKGLARAS